MKEFDSMAAFAAHLATMEGRVEHAARQALEHAAQLIEADAKGRIGTYQAEAGPFNAWAPLTPETEAEKERLGYPADSPLLRTGELRESLGHEVAGDEAVIGSRSPVALYQEQGTATVPPRPFLGPAAFSNRDKVAEILGKAVGHALAGEAITYGTGGELTPLPSGTEP